MNFKKLTAMVTAICFVYTGVVSPALQAAVSPGAPGGNGFEETLNGLMIPATVGRITAAKYYGSGKVVVNIQDLHCHPEVQRNISRILGELDERYPLRTVYLEGGYGDIDTSWLSGLKDEGLRKDAAETMVNEGRLTGAEYYSVMKNKPHLLKGIEDEEMHKGNIVRLGKMLEKKEEYRAKVKLLDRDLEFMEAKYFSSRNRRFNKLIESFREGKLPAEKYYRLLGKYVDKINRDPYSYNNVFTIDMDNYPNIKGYLELLESGKRLDYRRISRQLQGFVRVLKERLPFGTYNDILKKTDNFSKLDKLYVALSKLRREYDWDLRKDYPDLEKFFEYVDKGQGVNPVLMIKEEKRLVEEIRIGFAQDISELEVSFAADFYGYFKDYLFNRMAADDYRYFTERIGKFKEIWGKYAYVNRLKDMEGEFGLLDEYYRVNAERNRVFLEKILAAGGNTNGGGAGITAKEDGVSDDIRKVVESLDGSPEIVVVVTGGFHTEGLQALLDEKKVTYLSITPNVTQDTKTSSAVYEEFAKQQAKVLSYRREAPTSYLNIRGMFRTTKNSIRDTVKSYVQVDFKHSDALGLTIVSCQEGMERFKPLAARAWARLPQRNIAQLRQALDEMGYADIAVAMRGENVVFERDGKKIAEIDKAGEFVEQASAAQAKESAGTVFTDAAQTAINEAVDAVVELARWVALSGSLIGFGGLLTDILRNGAKRASDWNLITGEGLMYAIAQNSNLQKMILDHEGLSRDQVAKCSPLLQKMIAARAQGADQVQKIIKENQSTFIQALLAVPEVSRLAGQLGALNQAFALDEIEELRHYVHDYLEDKNRAPLFEHNEEELLDSFMNDRRLAIALRPVRQSARKSETGWFQNVGRNFAVYQRDLINSLDPSLRNRIFERKLLYGDREASIRQYLSRIKEKTPDHRFFDGLDLSKDLRSQGITVDSVIDYSSGKVIQEGAFVYRVLLRRGNETVSFFMKGLGLHDKEISPNTLQYHIAYYDIARLCGLNSLAITGSNEEYDDQVFGYLLMEEIPGINTNELFDREGKTFSIKKEYAGYQNALIDEFARYGALTDLLNRGDSRIVQNINPMFPANFMISLDALTHGRSPAVYGIDHNFLFNEHNVTASDLKRGGNNEMGILLAFNAFGPQGRARYRASYMKQWQEIRKQSGAIRQKIVALFGEDSREARIFDENITSDPQQRLDEEEAALSEYWGEPATGGKMSTDSKISGKPANEETRETSAFSSAEIDALRKYIRTYLADENKASSFEHNEEELLDSFMNENRLSIALRPKRQSERKSDPTWLKDIGLSFAAYQLDLINNLDPALRNRLFEGKLFYGDRESSIRQYLSRIKEKNPDQRFFNGLDLSKDLRSQGVTVDSIADYSSGRTRQEGAFVYRVLLRRGKETVSLFMKGFGLIDQKSCPNALQYHVIYYDIARLCSLNSIAIVGSNEKYDDQVFGYLLMEEIQGINSNELFDLKGNKFSIKKKYAGYQDALIDEFARYGALTDLLNKGDSKIVQNFNPMLPANSMVSLDALMHGRSSAVYGIDHNWLFNDQNIAISELKNGGNAEMGILLAFGSGWKELFPRYQASYMKQWQEMQKQSGAIRDRIVAMFGEDSREVKVFDTTIAADPQKLLNEQKAALREFLDKPVTHGSTASADTEKAAASEKTSVGQEQPGRQTEDKSETTGKTQTAKSVKKAGIKRIFMSVLVLLVLMGSLIFPNTALAASAVTPGVPSSAVSETMRSDLLADTAVKLATNEKTSQELRKELEALQRDFAQDPITSEVNGVLTFADAKAAKRAALLQEKALEVYAQMRKEGKHIDGEEYIEKKRYGDEAYDVEQTLIVWAILSPDTFKILADSNRPIYVQLMQDGETGGEGIDQHDGEPIIAINSKLFENNECGYYIAARVISRAYAGIDSSFADADKQFAAECGIDIAAQSSSMEWVYYVVGVGAVLAVAWGVVSRLKKSGGSKTRTGSRRTTAQRDGTISEEEVKSAIGWIDMYLQQTGGKQTFESFDQGMQRNGAYRMVSQKVRKVIETRVDDIYPSDFLKQVRDALRQMELGRGLTNQSLRENFDRFLREKLHDYLLARYDLYAKSGGKELDDLVEDLRHGYTDLKIRNNVYAKSIHDIFAGFYNPIRSKADLLVDLTLSGKEYIELILGILEDPAFDWSTVVDQKWRARRTGSSARTAGQRAGESGKTAEQHQRTAPMEEVIRSAIDRIDAYLRQVGGKSTSSMFDTFDGEMWNNLPYRMVSQRLRNLMQAEGYKFNPSDFLGLVRETLVRMELDQTVTNEQLNRIIKENVESFVRRELHTYLKVRYDAYAHSSGGEIDRLIRDLRSKEYRDFKFSAGLHAESMRDIFIGLYTPINEKVRFMVNFTLSGKEYIELILEILKNPEFDWSSVVNQKWRDQREAERNREQQGYTSDSNRGGQRKEEEGRRSGSQDQGMKGTAQKENWKDFSTNELQKISKAEVTTVADALIVFGRWLEDGDFVPGKKTSKEALLVLERKADIIAALKTGRMRNIEDLAMTLGMAPDKLFKSVYRLLSYEYYPIKHDDALTEIKNTISKQINAAYEILESGSGALTLPSTYRLVYWLVRKIANLFGAGLEKEWWQDTKKYQGLRRASWSIAQLLAPLTEELPSIALPWFLKQHPRSKLRTFGGIAMEVARIAGVAYVAVFHGSPWFLLGGVAVHLVYNIINMIFNLNAELTMGKSDGPDGLRAEKPTVALITGEASEEDIAKIKGSGFVPVVVKSGAAGEMENFGFGHKGYWRAKERGGTVTVYMNEKEGATAEELVAMLGGTGNLGGSRRALKALLGRMYGTIDPRRLVVFGALPNAGMPTGVTVVPIGMAGCSMGAIENSERAHRQATALETGFEIPMDAKVITVLKDLERANNSFVISGKELLEAGKRAGEIIDALKEVRGKGAKIYLKYEGNDVRELTGKILEKYGDVLDGVLCTTEGFAITREALGEVVKNQDFVFAWAGIREGAADTRQYFKLNTDANPEATDIREGAVVEVTLGDDAEKVGKALRNLPAGCIVIFNAKEYRQNTGIPTRDFTDLQMFGMNLLELLHVAPRKEQEKIEYEKRYVYGLDLGGLDEDSGKELADFVVNLDRETIESSGNDAVRGAILLHYRSFDGKDATLRQTFVDALAQRIAGRRDLALTERKMTTGLEDGAMERTYCTMLSKAGDTDVEKTADQKVLEEMAELRKTVNAEKLYSELRNRVDRLTNDAQTKPEAISTIIMLIRLYAEPRLNAQAGQSDVKTTSVLSTRRILEAA